MLTEIAKNKLLVSGINHHDGDNKSNEKEKKRVFNRSLKKKI
jgi:hypothetical protein